MAKITAKIAALGTTNKTTGEPNKGTLSVYGTAPRPWVSLYANQWLELAKVMPAIVKMVEQGLKDKTMAGPPEKSATTQADRVTLSA